MRICFAGNAASNHVRRFARWLGEADHDVLLLSDTPAPDGWTPRNVRVEQPRWPRLQALWTFHVRGGELANNRDKGKVYAPLIRAFAPDVVHAHEALAYGPVLAHVPEFARVLTCWGGDMMHLRHDPTGEAARLVRGAVRAAHRITTNAPGMEDEWARDADVPRDRFDLFSWGADLEVFHPRSAEQQRAVRERLGLDAECRIILSPRAAKAHYGIGHLIEAWKSLQQDSAFANTWLVILRGAADDVAWSYWVRRARGARMKRVLLVDEYLEPEEFAAFLSTAWVVVSIPERDLLACTVVEAVACGARLMVSPLRAYESFLAPRGHATDTTCEAIVLPSRGAEAIAQALRDVARQPTTDPAARAHQLAVVRAHHDAAKQAPRLLQVYEDARAEWTRERA